LDDRNRLEARSADRHMKCGNGICRYRTVGKFGTLPDSVLRRYSRYCNLVRGHLLISQLKQIVSIHTRIRKAGAGGPHRGAERRQTHAVRAEGPSGATARRSSHPDQARVQARRLPLSGEPADSFISGRPAGDGTGFGCTPRPAQPVDRPRCEAAARQRSCRSILLPRTGVREWPFGLPLC
jgi:hypothetical protein